MATMRRMAAALTAAMFAFGGFEVFATDGTWLAQPGVGTGGTNWAVWENHANWDGGIVADNGTATLPSSAVYVNSTNGVTLSMVTSGATTDSAYSVVRSDKTVAIDYASGNNLVNKVFLYSDWTWKCSSVYVGASAAQICGDCTSFSGNLLFSSTIRFRFDLYSNTAGETRTYEKILKTYGDLRGGGGSTLVLVAPCGSDEDVVGTWNQTDGSPFLSRAGEEHVLCVGTTVTGDGIPDGTFLKRVFPDGTIELSAAATNTVAANSLTFAAFAPDFSAGLGRIYPYNSIGVVTIKAQKHRAKDKARFTAYVQPSNGSFAAKGLVISTESGFVPATLALSSNAGYATKYVLQDCEIEFTGSGKTDSSDFHYCTFSIPDSAHTARLLVADGSSSSIGIVTNRVGTLVKAGDGRLSLGLPGDARANCTGAILVEEGTLEVRGASSGDNYIPSLTVKSGARLAVPEGVALSVGSLTVEDGAIFSGAGRLVSSGLSDAALRGLVLEDGISVEDGNVGGEFSIEVLRGGPCMAAQDGDSIFVFGSNAAIRVNGSGVFDVLVVGGGGGGGSKNGGGGGGGGVVYTQQLAVASGVYSIAVGLGGKGAPDKFSDNTSGGDSAVFGLRAYGGGAGGTYSRSSAGMSGQPLSGGSGGGGGTWYPGTVGTVAGADGVDGQGFAGGASYCGSAHWYYAGGGGGGAGGAGEAATMNSASKMVGGSGGEGVLCEIYGSKRYGGGGGGGVTSYGLADNFLGRDGGGDGGKTSGGSVQPGTNGTDGLGGGGGGGSGYLYSDAGAGGNGGSGVVILRWRQPAPSGRSLPDGDVAVGGTVRHKGGYAIHKFLDDGTFVLSEPALVDMLLVAGGGGGGCHSGGGGGGGGVVVISNLYLLAGSYGVTVGDGGVGAGKSDFTGFNGTDSVFSFDDAAYDLRAAGGGGGGTRKPGGAGGSGGGGGGPYSASADVSYEGGAGTDGQGCAGGVGIHTQSVWGSSQGAGGGGAGAPGGDATTSVPGNGGVGIVCDFGGEAMYYGGGGGGGSAMYSSASPEYYTSQGGSGGGGRGGSAYLPYPSVSVGESGTDGLGGGGGGGGGAGDAAANGGKGGDGVVIIRYRVRRQGLILNFY